MEQFEEINLKQLMDIILKRISLIIVVALLSGTAAFVFSEVVMTPTYESSVKMYVNNGSQNMDKTYGSDIQASQMLVGTYIVILKSDRVMNEVNSELHKKGIYDYDIEGLNSRISAISVNETEVFEVMVRDIDPGRTMVIANAVAEVFPKVIVEFIEASTAKVIDYASVGEQVSPILRTNIILGFLLGFVLCCIFVILREVFDMRIKSEDDLRKWFDAPILGIIPDMIEAQNYRHGYYTYNRRLDVNTGKKE